jgi:DNA-directed RNA polymerase beta subunit
MSKETKTMSKHKDKNTDTNNDNSDKKKNSNEYNHLTTSDIFRLMDLYFYKKNFIFRHLHNSFDKFIEEDLKNFLENEENHIFTEKMSDDMTFYRYRFKFENIRIQEPMLDNGIEPLFPSAARHNNLSYAVKVFADVTQFQDIIDVASDDKISRKNGMTEQNVLVAIIPLMVRSKYCTLTLNKGIDKNECDYDPGGYFLVKGNEKVVICQDTMIFNKPLAFTKKDSGLYIQVNSKSYKDKGIIQPLSIRIKKDLELLVKVPILNEVNVVVLIKALGIDSDRNIINYTTFDEYDTDMVGVIRVSLDMCKTDKGIKIATQEDALDYLISKMKIMNKTLNETDKDVKHAQKKKFLLKLLTNNLLPHVDENKVNKLINKAYYIGYMINKLVRVHLGRLTIDDRDSYVNKRIDLSGDLMYELYKQHHKKMLGECKKYFDQRNRSNEDPGVIINIIKPNIIEQGINAALSTGHWLRKQGVAQIVQRLSYLYTISLLRRIDAPGADASTMKLTTPRHLHPSTAGFLCCVTGDTEILQSDGTVKLIKDMKDGDSVITVDKQSLVQFPSKIKNYFSRENDKIIEITVLSGRKLKCTLDHPILAFMGGVKTMVDAGDLEVGNFVLIRPYEYDLNLNLNNMFNCENKLCDTDVKKFYLDHGIFAYPIVSITPVQSETVYDFTTITDTHTLIANGFVTSNCVETPEHAKIGLTKHLSMISSITIMTREQYQLISDYLIKNVTPISNIIPEKLRSHTLYKVFLNGDWLGITEDSHNLVKNIQKMRSQGFFDAKNTSVVKDDDECEIRVYCDSGRLYRPVLRVENNVIQMEKSDVEKISLNKNKKDKITSWEEFILKNPNIVDYVDMEAQPYVMIAHKIKKVEEMRLRMTNSIEKIKDIKSNHVENRYDDMMYVKYDYCEFHPSLLIGEIITNAPFSNMNPGQRNIFQYAQGRQAMTIYATNYRSRLDISYILYKPQRNLVHTRTSVYTNTRMLPPGENCLVAIGCYTGLTCNSPCHSQNYGKSKCDRLRC